MSPPRSMRAAMFYDVGDLRVSEAAVPTLESGDLLVRIAASGICSGDLIPWYIRRKAPLVIGHEPAGTVCAVGPGAPPRDHAGRQFTTGERVAIHHHAPCLRCRFCRRGDHVQCATWKTSRIEPGGIAEYVRVPSANLVDTLRLPESVPFADAVLVEPLGCVMKSLRRARLRADDLVYVIGLGVMGLLHVVAARERGCAVYGSDFRDGRRERAAALGASGAFHPAAALEALRAATGGSGADVVICGPGEAEALRHALDASAPGGRIVMFTPLEPGEDFHFAQSDAYFRDLSLISSYSCGPDDTVEALAFIERARLTSASLGAKCFTLERTAEAYETMRSGAVTKSIITFD